MAAGKNLQAHTAEVCVSQPAVTVPMIALSKGSSRPGKHQIRRVPVVDDRGGFTGIIALSDVAWEGRPHHAP